MSREFVGTGYEDPEGFAVYVDQGGTRQTFSHRVHGAYVDYRWDGGGPASTDLAQALLWVVTGVEPAWRTYRLFKNEVVAAWPRHAGECWRLSEDEIRLWLAELEQGTAQTETKDQTETRKSQMRARETNLRGFAEIFKKKLSRAI